MKRFKTKQEAKKRKDIYESLFNWTDYKNLWGLPEKLDPDYPQTNDVIFTTDPHPFDSMDIKVRVTPKQSKKLQKKAFKMGYKWNHGYEDKMNVYRLEAEVLYIRSGMLTFWDKYDDCTSTSCIELTHKQFMNGTVPKKKEAITADEIIKPEVMERLKDVTTLSIKACKSIKEVQDAYIQLQETIKK